MFRHIFIFHFSVKREVVFDRDSCTVLSFLFMKTKQSHNKLCKAYYNDRENIFFMDFIELINFKNVLLNELELRHVETLTTTCALIVRWSASVIKAGVALKINHYFPTRCGRTISKNRIFILCTSAMETMYIKLGVIYRDLWTSSDF